MSSWIITGAAGFIGSCLLAKLNQRNINNIIVVDNIASTTKWRNLLNKHYEAYIHKSELFDRISGIPDVEGVIHLGACSSTTEKNFDYLYSNNYQYSLKLYQFCLQKRIPFIYASSAAVYGNGQFGYSDDMDCQKLLPLNGYGYSKLLFDRFVCQNNCDQIQCVGLRFFNVYGPNEYHKGPMASMVYQGYQQIKATGKIRLFKSMNSEYADGEQARDFVYVDDICEVIMFFMQHPKLSGIFNVGTGVANTFNSLALALFNSLNMPAQIEYIDLPSNLSQSYQYYTKADIRKLREYGCNIEFTPIEQGIAAYVHDYLDKNLLIR